jgi:hypothetical protein
MPEQKPKPLILQWNQLTLEAIKLTNASPPVAARALAMVHTAIYDGWSVYHKCPFSTTTSRYIKKYGENCSENDMLKTCSYAAFRVLTDLFWLALPQEKRNMFRDLMSQCDFNPDVCVVDSSTPEGIGNLIAKLILDYRHGDESNQQGILFHYAPFEEFTGYQSLNPPEPAPVKDINHWQPLVVNGKTQKYLLPHWPLVKPFALVFAKQFRPEPPYNSKDTCNEFNKQVREVLSISENLSDKEKAIAEYWEDGPGTFTPSGHWCEIARFICEREKFGNKDCIKLFFALTNALLDASIACWECKRRYDSARPVTAIHELYRGKIIKAWGGPFKGTVEMDGKDWMPYQRSDFVTPPSPEHVSEHSTFSKAAAYIIHAYTKKESFDGCFLVKKGSSLIEPGKTPSVDIMLEWPTLSATVEEAGMAGLYGGIHFKRANESGQKLGAAVGKCVWEKVLVYFND